MKFKTGDRDTLNIFPLSINDAVKEGHPARFVVEIIEQLDLSEFEAKFSETGRQPYDVKILLGIIFYGYMTRTFASRKLEEATYDSIAYQYIAAGLHPDHSTIADFRKRFLNELNSVFAQILLIGAEMGIIKLKTAANDGSKILANASKHKAYSYDYLTKLEIQVNEELAMLNKMAEEVDNTPEGMNIPEELERRDARLTVIQKTKAEIERRADERYKAEKAEYDKKIEQRKEGEKKTGKKIGGRKPSPPTPGPKKRDQVNLTDAESRIMPKSGGGFEQGYNAHISVEVDTGIILANHVSQRTNDKLEMEPTIKELQRTEALLGQKVDNILSDAGFFSDTNVQLCVDANITPLIACKRDKQKKSLLSRLEHDDPDKIPEDADEVTKMKHRLNTKVGKELYALRKSTVEPVFGGIKHAMNFKQFSLRGHEAVKGEFKIVCIAWNIKKMFTLLNSQSTSKNKIQSTGNTPQQPTIENAVIELPKQGVHREEKSLAQGFFRFLTSMFGLNSEGSYNFEQDGLLSLD